jgi:hypothetical protein
MAVQVEYNQSLAAIHTALLSVALQSAFAASITALLTFLGAAGWLQFGPSFT